MIGQSIRGKPSGALAIMALELPLNIVIWRNAGQHQQADRAAEMLRQAVAERERRAELQADIERDPSPHILAYLAGKRCGYFPIARKLKLERGRVLAELNWMILARLVNVDCRGRYSVNEGVTK